ncbi:hypothetical protein IWX46DRAFT_610830, partial [Phyllosticta citricarpa]
MKLCLILNSYVVCSVIALAGFGNMMAHRLSFFVTSAGILSEVFSMTERYLTATNYGWVVGEARPSSTSELSSAQLSSAPLRPASQHGR